MRWRAARWGVAIAVLAAPARADEAPRLVATRVLEAAPYEVTLPEKVAVLEAGEHRTLAFEVSGRLETVAVEGALVEAGEVVAQLDAALERAYLRQAELQLREARSERERVRGLRKSGAASAKALERAEVAGDLRAAEQDAAREQLERKQLAASFAGVISDVRFEPGEVVNPGLPVATLMSLGELRLEVGVPGYQVGRVSEGARVLVSVPALSGLDFEGVVHRVAPAAAERRHLFEVEIRVPNAKGRLRPGMTARARIVIQRLDGVLAVPLEAAVPTDGGLVVYFVAEEHARAVPMSDATLHGDRLLVPASLPYRELVLRGQRDLREGVPVRVDNAILDGVEER